MMVGAMGFEAGAGWGGWLADAAPLTRPMWLKLWDFFGVLHPATVHMPIGLIMAAAIFIVLRWRFPRISGQVPLCCLVLGSAASWAAVAMGWSFAAYMGYGGTFRGPEAAVFWHRWGGLAVAVLATGLSVAAIRFSRRRGTDAVAAPWQVMTLVLAGLTGLVGHQGGTLTYGEDLYSRPFEDPKPVVVPDPRPDATTGKVDFATQVAPIFAAWCIECHGPDKDKAGLRLHNGVDAFESGDSAGFNIVAGKPDESYLVEVMELDADADELMPPAKKGGPLPAAQIAVIRRWIAQGAVWPEGLVVEEAGP